jgi:hypothetical protein
VIKVFDIDDARYIGKKLDIDFNKYDINEFLVGLNIELEHGRINPITNVTNSDLEKTAKIAYAHLLEFPDYYNNDYGLPALERVLDLNKNKTIGS